MLRRVNNMQPSQSRNFPDFPPVPLPKPELLKLTIIIKIEMLDDKDANFHLDRKKGIFSHTYRGSSRSSHGVTTHVKPPGFKQLD